MGWATETAFISYQQYLYSIGDRYLPYYYRQYPSLLGSELDSATYPGITYHQYSQPTVPGFHDEGL